jgi:hypothetical protein
MPLSDSRRRANAKYDKKTYSMVGAKISKDNKAKLLDYCTSHNITVNALLNRLIAATLDGDITIDTKDGNE